MKKQTIFVLIAIIGLVVGGIFFLTKKSAPKDMVSSQENSTVDLPINVLPLSERPFITLSPDDTGRSLSISIMDAPKEGSMEYEMIYNAAGKQEGALGSIFLGSEAQPIVKAILLGSKSGGGKVTYHEGVTGGSITLTYGENRLKESWNYLKFDPTSPEFSTTDGRLSVMLPKTALKKDTVIVSMKTFGYAKLGLPASMKVIVGPYGYFTQTQIKGSANISMKLPAGEHVNPTIYEWDGKTWKKLVTKLDKDVVTALASANVFVVTSE